MAARAPGQPEPHELRRIIESVEGWRKLSDGLFKVGPLKLGLDGVLTWIPGVGDAYTLGASGFLLYNAGKAHASRATLSKMVLLLGTDALIGAVPILGDAFDFVFRAHARSARILLKELNAHPALADGAPEPRPATAGPEHGPPASHPDADERAQARRVEDLRRELQGRGA